MMKPCKLIPCWADVKAERRPFDYKLLALGKQFADVLYGGRQTVR